MHGRLCLQGVESSRLHADTTHRAGLGWVQAGRCVSSGGRVHVSQSMARCTGHKERLIIVGPRVRCRMYNM